jgi:phenylacetate-coenzyme A ligase PaaK-like adenylate-forming protein
MWDPGAERMSADERAGLQARRLDDLLGRLAERSPLYRERLAGAGIGPGARVGLDGLADLPFTTKQDLWDGYPWGLLTVPRSQVVRVHGSSGTGGRPTLVAYSRTDLDIWAQVCARALGCAGAGPGTVTHVAYGYGLFTGGLGLHGGAELMGCTVVPASSGQSSRQVLLLRDLGAEVLCCTPSYAVRLGEVLGEEGIGKDELRLRAGIFGAEPWSEAMRAQIESLLPLRALDIYGLSEVIGPGVSCECIEGQAGLHVSEDHFLVEVVDPETGRQLGPGDRGELVFTTLTRDAMPVLRYRTGDIASLDPSPCVCGRTLVRMSKVTGRKDDMLVIRGVNVYPSEVEAVLVAERAVGPQYLLVVDRTEPCPSWWWPASWRPGGRSAPRPRRPSAPGWLARWGRPSCNASGSPPRYGCSRWVPSPGSRWARRSGLSSGPMTTIPFPVGSRRVPSGCGRRDGTVGGVWETRQPCIPSS